MKTYKLELNEYQRDNLLWLLLAVGGYSYEVAPVEVFNMANTGDWVHELLHQLDPDKPFRANSTLDDLREAVRQHLTRHAQQTKPSGA